MGIVTKKRKRIQSYNRDVDLGQPEVNQRIEESDDEEKPFGSRQTWGFRHSADKWVSTRYCHHNVNKAHNVGFNIFQNVFTPKITSTSQFFLCFILRFVQCITISVNANDSLQRSDSIIIASLQG